MAANVRGNDINEVFIKSLEYLESHGSLINPKGTETREVSNFTYELTNIHNNVLTIPFRNNNFASICFETLWVLSGRNDLKYLKYFLPNCVDYSDKPPSPDFQDFTPKGGTWGGAYGPRLKYGNNTTWRWNFQDKNNPDIVLGDQIFNIIRTLREDQFSRQAIIIIGTSDDYEFDLKTKDRPCNVSIQFLIRHGRLNCTIYQRSGDAIWGTFNINIFEWTTLMKLIADCLNIETGTLTHHITSFHYYIKQHGKTVNNILSVKNGIPNIYDYINIRPFVRENGIFNDYYKMLEYHYANIAYGMSLIEKNINEKDTEITDVFVEDGNCHYVMDIYRVVELFILMKEKHTDRLIDKLKKFKHNDLYLIAILEYMVRYFNKNDTRVVSRIEAIAKRKFKEEETINFITWSSR
jgi:thymidylate synthase